MSQHWSLLPQIYQKWQWQWRQTVISRSLTRWRFPVKLTLIQLRWHGRKYSVWGLIMPYGITEIGQYWLIKSLRANYAIWHHRNRTILIQVIACWLRDPSPYLNQCLPLITEVLCYSSKGNLTGSAQDICAFYGFENVTFKITDTSSKGQWVNYLRIGTEHSVFGITLKPLI